MTRVGGLPWLPKSVRWPTVSRRPATFLCQFDFRDSRDLVGDLPGDLLLVFVADERAIYDGVKRMRFVWASADDIDVVTEADVPEGVPSFDFVSAWGREVSDCRGSQCLGPSLRD